MRIMIYLNLLIEKEAKKENKARFKNNNVGRVIEVGR